MAKVTSKLQVTIPKKLAEQYGITPGDSVLFQEAGDVILVIRMDTQAPSALDRSRRLALFDAATQRKQEIAARILRSTLDAGNARIPHQVATASEFRYGHGNY